MAKFLSGIKLSVREGLAVSKETQSMILCIWTVLHNLGST